MFTLRDSVCIEASREQVWSVLERIEDIPLWSSAVVAAQALSGHERGVGAQRVCEVRGGIRITERWREWNEGRSFTYEGHGLPGVISASNTWSIEAYSSERTLLHTEATVVLKGGRLARVAEPIAKFQSRRMGRKALAAFKYLAETGAAPDLKTRQRAPTHC
jgi:hypothetical protein